jgi:hypothetical protein
MEQQEAIDKLHELLKPGDTVYTVLRHVSRSGMTRAISPIIMTDDGPWEISYLACPALGWRFNERHGGVTVSGCGMDTGFHLVYEISREMYPDGFECIGEGCPSNDHVNGDRNYKPHHHNSGGYALQQRWM